MLDMTAWDSVLIYPIISFIGVFSIMSVLSARHTVSAYFPMIFRVLMLPLLLIAFSFWSAIMIHNISGMWQIDPKLFWQSYYNISLVVFSYGWGLILLPTFMFMILLRRT